MQSDMWCSQWLYLMSTSDRILHTMFLCNDIRHVVQLMTVMLQLVLALGFIKASRALKLMHTVACNTSCDAIRCDAIKHVMQMMTLMLQLLFVASFKKSFSGIMLKHYSRLMEEWSVKPSADVLPLDMITVQLFNDEVGGTQDQS